MYCNPSIACDQVKALLIRGQRMNTTDYPGVTYYAYDEANCCSDKDFCNVPFTMPFNDTVGPKKSDSSGLSLTATLLLLLSILTAGI